MPGSRARRWRASPTVREHARALRQELTLAERRLWQRLRGHQLCGAHFRKQHPVGPYVIDFVCMRARLAIEIDGDSHVERDEYDAKRTQWLERNKGYRVMRFSNEEVLQHMDGVLEMIADALNAPPL